LNYPPAAALLRAHQPSLSPTASRRILSRAPPAASIRNRPGPRVNGGATPAAAPQNKTFENTPEQNKPAPESRLLLPPRTEPSSTGGVPRGLDPEVQDRVTAIPLRQPWGIRTASALRPARSVEAKQIDSEWRSVRP
jgi:hypothetical protein